MKRANSSYDNYWKIDGRDLPGFVILPGQFDSERILKTPHIESDAPYDKAVTLEILKDYPGVALISGIDGRGTNDGSPPYKKFLCFSMVDGRQIMTTYQAYTVNKPVIVTADNDKKKYLLENVDMHHVDITPCRTAEGEMSSLGVIEAHLKRIGDKGIKVSCLRDLAE